MSFLKKNQFWLWWALLLIPLWGSLVPILGHVYSPDSFAYQLIGRALFSGEGFSTIAMRDLNWTDKVPMPSRSFPPEWPLIVGLADWVSGLGILAASWVNLFVVALTVMVSFYLLQAISPLLSVASFALYPVFVVTNVEFRYEVAAGRLIPFTLLALLCLLSALVWQLRASHKQWAEMVLGVVFAVLFLSRFDQLFFSAWFLGSFYFIQRWAERSPRQALLSTIRIAATFALCYAPWAIRNILVFGSPIATDNTFTVTSLFPGINPTSYWAAGHPPTLWQNPGLWVAQRWFYLVTNCTTLLKMSYGLCLLGPGLALWQWRRLSFVSRVMVWMALGSIVTQIIMVSLTPYFFETRYFSVPHYLSMWIGILALKALLVDKRQVRWAQALAGLVLIVVMVSSGSLKGFGRHIGSHYNGIVPDGLGPLRDKYQHVAELLQEQQFDPRTGVIGYEKCEEMSYFTHFLSVQVPTNNNGLDEDFKAWLRRFKPSFLLAEQQWLQSMALEKWQVGQTAEGVSVLKVPVEFRQ